MIATFPERGSVMIGSPVLECCIQIGEMYFYLPESSGAI
jgi:hypothetical protein